MKFNMNALIKPLQKSYKALRMKTIKHSPDILVVAGVGSMIAGTALAIKSSLDVKDILTDAAAELEDIREDETELINSTHPDDAKELVKDKARVYIHYGLELTRMYAPAAICVFGGAASVFKGHNILKNRNVALAASYAALDSSYSAYKKRIAEQLGTEKAADLEYGVEKETVKEGKSKKTVKYVTDNNLSMYAYPFKACYSQTASDGQTVMVKNPYFQDDELFDLSWLKSAETYVNLQLETRGYVYLSDIYDRLGITTRDQTSELASRVMGWVDDGSIHQITFFSYISDGIDPYENPEYLMRDHDGNILLDFNVQGNVLEML